MEAAEEEGGEVVVDVEVEVVVAAAWAEEEEEEGSGPEMIGTFQVGHLVTLIEEDTEDVCMYVCMYGMGTGFTHLGR